MKRTTSLDTGWQFAAKTWLEPPGRLGFSQLEWLPAHVPGHVHLDLLAHGIIADPYVALGELGSQWVDEQDFSYRVEFDFVADSALPSRVLRFEGLDAVCNVSLNGERIAEHDNMFVPLEVDVSGRLVTGPNELRVDFLSASRVGRERRARYLETQGIDPGVARFDERAFLRKAQYMFGWDWGPRLVSLGIWRPVTLVEHEGRLLDVRIEQRHLSDGSVEVWFESQAEGAGQVVHRLQGVAELVQDGQRVRIERPRLWHPAVLGAQELYVATSWLVPRQPRDAAEAECIALDRMGQRIGLRSLKLVREPDRFGECFEFVVNQRPLWVVGANWIPDSSFPSAVRREELRAQLLRARDMNMNMVRVWGGGLYETDDFYDLCDEFGLLVWQDFPYACSYVPDDEAAQQVARNEAGVHVRRLRNHPSLALWCGNNENLTMYETQWGGSERQPPRYYGGPIYDDVLPSVLAELDPGRPYIPSSPSGGPRANSGGVGDQHYWDVWHGRGDYVHYDDSTARFASEFGFASAPGRATWKRMAPDVAGPQALDARSLIARWHDKTGKGAAKFVEYVELHYPRSQNAEEWLFTSQCNQRDALRYGIEHYRRSEFCRGALIWQLNDCWPVQSWAVVDSEGDYKAAAYELRRLYAPLLVSLVRAGNVFSLWVVLDNARDSVEGDAVVEARSLRDGQLLERWSTPAVVAPQERRAVLRADVGNLNPRQTILVASFAGASRFALLVEPKDVLLSEPQLVARSSEGTLRIESDAPVVDLCLWDAVGRVVWLDNCVTLAEPGSVELRVQGSPRALRARSLRGPHAVRWEGELGAG